MYWTKVRYYLFGLNTFPVYLPLVFRRFCYLTERLLETWCPRSSFFARRNSRNTEQIFVTSYITEMYRVILSVLDPRKCEYLKDYSLDFEHECMTTYLASWEECRYLFAALWHPDVIGTTTGVWRHVAHSPVNVLCGSEGECCTRICGSTWWWRALKRLFSAGWSHMPHIEWEHDQNRKLFWWPDYFESLMAAKISWLKSPDFSCGAP